MAGEEDDVPDHEAAWREWRDGLRAVLDSGGRRLERAMARMTHAQALWFAETETQTYREKLDEIADRVLGAYAGASSQNIREDLEHSCDLHHREVMNRWRHLAWVRARRATGTKIKSGAKKVDVDAETGIITVSGIKGWPAIPLETQGAWRAAVAKECRVPLGAVVIVPEA